MLKGGYQIIDFKNTVITELGIEFIIDGIFDKLKTKKAIMFSGLIIDFYGNRLEFNDMFVQFALYNGNYYGHIHTYGKGSEEQLELEIIVKPNDGVTINSAL